MTRAYHLFVEVETNEKDAMLKALRGLDPECLPQHVIEIRPMDPEKDITVTGRTDDALLIGYDGETSLDADADIEAISKRIMKAALQADPKAHVQVNWWDIDEPPVYMFDSESSDVEDGEQ